MKLKVTRTATGKSVTFDSTKTSFHRIWKGLFPEVADRTAQQGDIFAFTTSIKTCFPSKDLAANIGVSFRQVA